jgi:hypothetical protein
LKVQGWGASLGAERLRTVRRVECRVLGDQLRVLKRRSLGLASMFARLKVACHETHQL